MSRRIKPKRQPGKQGISRREFARCCNCDERNIRYHLSGWSDVLFPAVLQDGSLDPGYIPYFIRHMAMNRAWRS